jgi:hypothetical protein
LNSGLLNEFVKILPKMLVCSPTHFWSKLIHNFFVENMYLPNHNFGTKTGSTYICICASLYLFKKIRSRVARFFLVQHTKTVKIHQMAAKKLHQIRLASLVRSLPLFCFFYSSVLPHDLIIIFSSLD